MLPARLTVVTSPSILASDQTATGVGTLRCVLFHSACSLAFVGRLFMFLRSSMHGQLSHRGDLLPGYESLLMLSPVVVTTFLKMPHLGYERIV
jgi:hypothetical protein